MAASRESVDSLLSQIDEIDASILKALDHRFQISEKLYTARRLPKGTLSYAPDREALSLRRLLRQKQKFIHSQALVRIWREIISAGARMYRPFNIAVYTKERGHDMMDLAKNYFGSDGCYLSCISTSQAIQKISSKGAGVAVLPLFEQSEDSWWTALSSPEHKHLAIVARLPFGKTKNYLHSNEAFVVGTVPSEPTGLDKSLFAVEMSCQTSMASLKKLLEDVGFTVDGVWPAYNLSRIYLFAIELNGYVTMDDDRMVLFQARHKNNIQMMRRIGGYAVQEELED